MPNQYFAALTNMRSVGVMGDFRTYDYAVALRAVKTIDFMTAESAEIPYAVLNKVMNRIINEVKGVNRVFYDLDQQSHRVRLSLSKKMELGNPVFIRVPGLFAMWFEYRLSTKFA